MSYAMPDVPDTTKLWPLTFPGRHSPLLPSSRIVVLNAPSGPPQAGKWLLQGT